MLQSIKELLNKVNIWRIWREMDGEVKWHLMLLILVILVGFASFGLGRLSADRKEPIIFRYNEELQNNKPTETSVKQSADSGEAEQVLSGLEEVVGSKNSDKWHYTWCPGAKQISEKNLVRFQSVAAAQSAGYIKAGNCK